MSFDTSYIAGATSKIVKVKAITISTGLPYTGGAFNTATIAATYTRDGGTATTITLVTATAGTYTSSGFVHAGKGVYEIGAPTAALAAGADGVIFSVDGIADVLFSNTRVELTGVDPRSAAAVSADVTKWNGTTVTTPNTAGTPVVDVVRFDGTATTALVEVTSVPTATTSFLTAFRWMYLKSRNKITQTATTQLVKANDGTTTVGTSTVSDDGTTATRGAFS